MVAYGTTLGLDVRGVDLMARAYEEFTGSKLVGKAAAAPPLSAPVTTVAQATTQALLARLRAESAAAQIPAAEAAIVAADLTKAAAAQSSGDVATAYGLAVDGYSVLQRAIGAARTNASIAAGGVAAARDAMRADVAALRARAAEVLRAGSDVASLNVVAQLNAPFALGWTTFADSVLAGIETGLADGSITTAGYVVTGAAIAEQRASIEVFQPDALAMNRAAPNPNVQTVHPPAEFVSGYTTFLVRAAQANLDYFRDVISRNRVAKTDAKGNPAFTVLALDALAASAATIQPGIQAIDDEIRQSALAVTAFIIGTGLVANTSDKGISGSGEGVDAITTVDSPGLVLSVTSSARLVEEYAGALSTRSIDTGAQLWSARWGVATATALNGSGRDAMGEVIALNELWYDDVSMAMLWAGTTPE